MGGFSRGGAIYNGASTLRVENCTFQGNQALGGSNNTGGNTTGQGSGGAIMNADQAILFLTGSTFTDNLALGGSNNISTSGTGTLGNSGGGGLMNVGVATITDSQFENNEARGGSGNRGNGADFQFVGSAAGGAINTTAASISGTPSVLTLRNVTLRHNRAIGGDGNMAGTVLGTGQGGGIAASGHNFARSPGGCTTTFNDSTITDNQAIGGRGADGENGADGVGAVWQISSGRTSASQEAWLPTTRLSVVTVERAPMAVMAWAAACLTIDRPAPPPTLAPRRVLRS